MFPDGLRLGGLPKLACLTVYIEWLQDTETIQRVVDCCPGLEALCIECYGGNELAEIQPQRWGASLGCLTGLSTLTRLSMDTIDVSMTADVYTAIGALTGLRELRLGLMDPTHLGPAADGLSAAHRAADGGHGDVRS